MTLRQFFIKGFLSRLYFDDVLLLSEYNLLDHKFSTCGLNCSNMVVHSHQFFEIGL